MSEEQKPLTQEQVWRLAELFREAAREQRSLSPGRDGTRNE